ncbi:MAG: hypothetical protein RLZZ630_1982 [Bacteroidota bacterium]|jgi:flavin reductase (DIM6/NTAB) family NADH-FMN oxidoreductase RutF
MRKPWNRPDLPVYSAATTGKQGGNMNICTYVIAVSMTPKRMAVAFYKGTMSLQNVQHHPHFILQLLASDQYKLVRLLGQKSGRTIDKLSKLKDSVGDYRGFTCLNNAAARMACDIIEWIDAGDHMLAICDVVSYANLRDTDLLTTGLLREKKIIRA